MTGASGRLFVDGSSWQSGSDRSLTCVSPRATPRSSTPRVDFSMLYKPSRRYIDGGSQNDPDPTDLEAREAAIASCPPQYQEWLKDELKYAHEPSLRRRLREVLRFVGPGLRPLTGKP